jgi:hypothetical protein
LNTEGFSQRLKRSVKLACGIKRLHPTDGLLEMMSRGSVKATSFLIIHGE